MVALLISVFNGGFCYYQSLMKALVNIRPRWWLLLISVFNCVFCYYLLLMVFCRYQSLKVWITFVVISCTT